MAYLLKIVKPHIGVVTNVSLEHSVYFDPLVKKKGEQRTQELLELIAKEETRLLTALPEEGTAIINLDDAFIGNTQKINSHKVSISLKNKTADLYIERIHIALERFVMEFLWKGKNYSLTIPQALPEFYAYEFLFVLATCMGLGMGPSEVLNSLENHFSLPPGRLSIFQGITNTTIIDSSYNNATLEPILGILDMLKKIAQDRRKVAIVGDMREQGSQSKESHEVLADKIAHCVSIPILIGPLLANYAAPILKRKKKKFYSFQTFSEAKKTILSVIEPRDIILVKGSQNTLFLERAVEILLADKDNVKSLCRRGIFWDRLREKTP